MAKFCCSIETEPRTLNQGQLHQAREVAIDMVQNKEADQEASNMSIDEMKPVFTTKEMIMAISEANEKTRIIETSCQCSCPTSTAATMDSPIDQSGLVKEPLSSPF